MIICITGTFPIIVKGVDTGRTEFVVSHGIDAATLKTVILPCEHPRMLGARFDMAYGEWVIDD